jgi:hypothetical protein
VRILGGGLGDDDERAVAAGQRDVIAGRLPQHGSDDMNVRRPGTRVLELREGRDQAQLGADPAVQPRQRSQPEPAAGLVELCAPLTEPALQRRLEQLPESRPDGAPRQFGTKRVGRESGGSDRVEVGDQRRDRNALELARHRRREREDVMDDHIDGARRDRRARRRGCAENRLVWLQRPLAGGEDREFGGGYELHSGRGDVLAPT